MKPQMFLCLAVAMMMIFPATLFADDADLSLWFKRFDKENYAIPWLIASHGNNFIDIRYNFDAYRTGGVFMGKKISRKGFTFMPGIGVLICRYNAFSPELLIVADTKHWIFFSQNQYALGGSKNFGYHWVDLIYKVKPWLAVGADEQVYKENCFGTQVDVGPAVKVTVRKTYFRVWSAWSVGPANAGKATLYLATGYTF